jgi:beta-ureidopropionase / N-carbamoyl-L-amino-acid hydrolase
MELRVNFPRLQAEIEELARIGLEDADHGIYRQALSDAHAEATRWFIARAEAAGLETYVDGAANVHARLGWDGKRPSIATGSHLDTVPAAGHLDGALGVLAGLECLRRLRELSFEPVLPLEVISFLDEEGRFGSMPGSQAIAGRLTPEAIFAAKDLEGIRFVDAMKERGYDAMHALRAARTPESMEAFVELHIEQGPVLDRQGVRLGVVEGIVGLFKWNVRLIGTANHAGTTPMDLRQDAFGGLAEFSMEIPRILEENGGPRSVATIGRVELIPGAANVVPGRAEFTLDVRDIDAEVLANLARSFRTTLSAIARRRDLMFEFDVLSELEPVRCDRGIMRLIEEVGRSLDEPLVSLPSGAAHDTQQLAAITRVGMIFVPSKQGRSHSPAEWTPWEAIEVGANALLGTLHKLAS